MVLGCDLGTKEVQGLQLMASLGYIAKTQSRSVRLGQWVKVLAAQPGDLSLTPWWEDAEQFSDFLHTSASCNANELSPIK